MSPLHRAIQRSRAAAGLAALQPKPAQDPVVLGHLAACAQAAVRHERPPAWPFRAYGPPSPGPQTVVVFVGRQDVEVETPRELVLQRYAVNQRAYVYGSRREDNST